MKQLYFVQVGFSFSKTLVYLPYAAGCMLATAFSDGEIAACFERNDIIFQRDTIENNLKCIHQPDIVAFSNYFWNVNYNKTLAKKIKDADDRLAEVEINHDIKQNDIEATDLPSEITNWKVLQSIYNASLQMGSSFLQQSIFNYIN